MASAKPDVIPGRSSVRAPVPKPHPAPARVQQTATPVQQLGATNWALTSSHPAAPSLPAPLTHPAPSHPVPASPVRPGLPDEILIPGRTSVFTAVRVGTYFHHNVHTPGLVPGLSATDVGNLIRGSANPLSALRHR